MTRATLYAIFMGLVIAASQGWAFVLVYAAIVGVLVGVQHDMSANKEKDKSSQ